MQRSKSGSRQTNLRTFYEKNPRSRQRRSKKKVAAYFPSGVDLSKDDLVANPNIVVPKDGQTDFGAFARPQPDISAIVNFGLIFKLIDIKCLISNKNDQKETLQIYGVTENQNSVLVRVNDYRCSIIAGFQSKRQSQELNLEDIRARLNIKLTNRDLRNHEIITKIELYMGLLTADQKLKTSKFLEVHYLKFFVSHVRYVEELRKLLTFSDDYVVSDLDLLDETKETYYKLDFLKEKNITMFGWVYIQPEDLCYRSEERKVSICQIEVDVQADKIVPLFPAGDDNGTWPVRIMSFDLECETVANEGFPRAEKRPIIQIANTCKIIERSASTEFKNIFVVGSCSPIEGADIYAYTNDDQLLRNWRAFMHTFDPDIVIGYNIVGFDFRYISKRAQKCKIEDFFTLGRLKNLRFTSNINPFVEQLNVDGRIILDMTSVMRAECPGLPKYGLGAVSTAILGETKCDVHYSELYDLQHGNADTRRTIAIYCIQDTNLPMRLLDKLNIMELYANRVRSMGILFEFATKKKNPLKKPKFGRSYTRSGVGQTSAKDKNKKLFRSSTQAIDSQAGLSPLEHLLETFSGPYIFKVFVPALYKKQNYKLNYLKVKRMFIKVYCDKTTEILGYLADQAFDNLSEDIEKVDEILVTKFVVEEPKPGQKILRICNAMALEVNYKAVDALKSIMSITWIGNYNLLYESSQKANNNSKIDIELVDDLLDSVKNASSSLPFYSNEITNQKGVEYLPTHFGGASTSCTQKPENAIYSSQRPEPLVKRSLSCLNYDHPRNEYSFDDTLKDVVSKKQKAELSTIEEEKVQEGLNAQLRKLYIPVSFMYYPNLKWVIRCLDYEVSSKGMAENKYFLSTQSFPESLANRTEYQLLFVDSVDNNVEDSQRVLAEEICTLSDSSVSELENRIRARIKAPEGFSLMNSAFHEKNGYYIIVHSSYWNTEVVRSTSQEMEPTTNLYFMLRIQQA